MAIDDIAGSGPEAGNTGAVEPVKVDGITAAIDKAFAGLDGEGDVPVEVMKTKADATKASESDGTDQPNPEVLPKPAAPKGDAVLEAPKHWPADRRTAFASLAPDAQKALLTMSKDLEGGYTKKSMELSDTVKYADSIRGLLGDDRTKQQLSQAGLDEVGYVRYLHSLQNFATSDPSRYIAWAMQNLGVSPEQLGFGQRPPANQQQSGTGDPQLDDLLLDPHVKQLRDIVNQQNQTLQQLQGRLAAEDRQRQEYTSNQQRAARSQLENLWTNFRSAIDDAGQLAHPHADSLMQQMGAIMETDPEIAPLADGPDKLQAAYDAAIWARPSLRTHRLESEKAAATAAASRAAEAERAKRVASVKRASGAPGVQAKKSGLDGALEAAMAAHGRN